MSPRKARTKPKTVPGAPESSAGDDFHLLWASRKALELLLPRGDLKALGVEGAASDDAIVVDRYGDRLLAIDVSEYYGGETFESASRVIHSQLKYSTRRPSEQWTAARLCQGKKSGTKGSIIHRLAQAFHAYRSRFGREKVLSRLSLKLVSNRTISPSLKNALNGAQQIFKAKPKVVSCAHLFNKLSGKDRSELQRLVKATGFSSTESTDFLRVLDLSDCGAGSRLDQEEKLFKALSSHDSSEVTRQYEGLKGLIHRRMMPESRRLLRAEDVVPIFGFPSLQSAFPAEARFEHLVNPIKRLQIPSVARTVIEHKSGIICIHGGAGCGKTTFVRSLSSHMPRSSIVVVFDCYGAGSYLDPDEVRHGHSRAILQIANDLATQTGSPLLLSSEHRPQELLRELTKRLTIAAALIRTASPDALVVLVVDAADNSIAAGERFGDKTFVQDLVRCSIPEGCRLIVTTRTHRKRTLDLPPTTAELELHPFERSESEAHLRNHVSSPTDEQVEEFHCLSNGIPRVQTYALTRRAEGINAILEALRPSGKTVEVLIDQQIIQASRKLGNEPLVAGICKSLISLPRPVPIAYVAELSQVGVEVVRDFCVDMWPGVREEEGFVSFRDEDFETHLTNQYGQDKEWFDKSTSLLLVHSDTDPYAAIHLGNALYTSRRYGDLRRLVIDVGLPQVIKDHLRQRDTFVKRARLALSASTDINDRVEYFKLLLIAAEAAKTDNAVQKLVGENADLASKYGDPVTVQRLFLSDKSSKWYGPGHLQCGAVFGRDNKTHVRAKEHLRAAEGWIRWWMTLPEDERSDYSIFIKDIVAGTEAFLRVYGPKHAKKWLGRWRPKSTIYEATRQVALRCLRSDSRDEVWKWFGTLGLRADLGLAILDASSENNISPPPSLIKHLAKLWRRFGSRGFKPSKELFSGGIFLCEELAKIERSVTDLLDMFTPNSPDYPHTILETEGKTIDLFLRGRVLRAICQGNNNIDVETLYPERLRGALENIPDSEKRRITDDRDEFKSLYGFLLPAYQLRTRALLGELKAEKAEEQFRECLRQIESDYKVRGRYDRAKIMEMLALTLLDSAIKVSANPAMWLRDIEKACEGNTFIVLLLDMAEKCIALPTLHLEALRLIDVVRKKLESNPGAASEQVRTLLRCARIGETIDPEVGRAYFELALKAASDIDEEAISQLLCLAQLSRSASTDEGGIANPQLAHKLARFVEVCRYRLEGWDHFPIAHCMAAITHLDVASGFAVLSRWDDRGVIGISEEILPVLEVAVQRGFLTPSLAYSMTILSHSSDRRITKSATSFSEHALRKEPPVRSEVSRILDQATKDITLHAPLDTRQYRAQEIVSWAERNGFEHEECVQTLKRLYNFLKDVEEGEKRDREESSSHPTYLTKERDTSEQSVNWNELLRDSAFVDSSEIERAIQALPGEQYQKHGLMRELIERMKGQCKTNQYRAQLDALIRTSSDILPFDSMLDAISSRLSEWSVHPTVSEWKQSAAKEILERRFIDFLGSHGISRYRIDSLTEVFENDKNEFISSLALGLPECLKVMSASALYDVAEYLIPSLPKDGALQILEWILSRLASKIKDESGDGPWRDNLMPPQRAEDVVSAFFWKVLGHPDKRVRWQAAHAIRRMVHFGHGQMIKSLVERANDKECASFKSRGYHFYWLSARLWLFILLDRLAIEAPEAVHPYANFVASEAIAPETPHALIRFFAKKTALCLSAKYPNLFLPETLAKLNKVSVSQYEQVVVDPSERYKTRENRFVTTTEGERFHFDSLDTIPYWYQPLGDIFGSTTQEVTKIAEHFICDKWGYTGKIWEADPLHINRRYDYHLTTNGHGSEPIVENLQTYLEYHSMFCVADKLLEEQPLIKDSYSEREPWNEWLKRWNLTREDSWLADYRDATPLEKAFWTLDRKDEKTWKSDIISEDFDRALGILEPLHSGYLIAKAYIHRYLYKDYETVSVSSALVSPKTAPALLRALQTTKMPSDYRIPPEGDELEIDEPDFKLKGWLKSESIDYGGLDEHDPLRNQLDKNTFFPGTEFREWANLCISIDGRKSWRAGSPEHPVSLFEHWNDCPKTRYEGGFRTEGTRLWIAIKDLLEFLKSRGHCLIVDCHINRHVDDREKADYGIGQSQLYLIYSDGQIETLAGNTRLR